MFNLALFSPYFFGTFHLTGAVFLTIRVSGHGSGVVSREKPDEKKHGLYPYLKITRMVVVPLVGGTCVFRKTKP